MAQTMSLAAAASTAKGQIAAASTAKKNQVLADIAALLRSESQKIVAANKIDIKEAKKAKLKPAMIERLTLSAQRVSAMAKSLDELISLADPIGEEVSGSIRPNGLVISQRRVPIGLVAMIYESRPNVTLDAAALCIKSGNAVILRGGKEAINSNLAIVDVIKQALQKNDISPDVVALVSDTSRDSVGELLNMVGMIDLLIPRGGKGLIEFVVQNAKVPVIETGAGNCHVYVDSAADLNMAYAILENAKMSRPSVCNSAETLLVHADVAEAFLPMVQNGLLGSCELRGCDRARAILPDMAAATEDDWYEEYNDYILAVKVVPSVESAVAHINKYGTHHSETIVTDSVKAADTFLNNVDAAAVYRNASTRFTDGGEFGLSVEIGISTAKLHVRGPMGLNALTTTKYTVLGDGQIRV